MFSLITQHYSVKKRLTSFKHNRSVFLLIRHSRIHRIQRCNSDGAPTHFCLSCYEASFMLSVEWIFKGKKRTTKIRLHPTTHKPDFLILHITKVISSKTTPHNSQVKHSSFQGLWGCMEPTNRYFSFDDKRSKKNQ